MRIAYLINQYPKPSHTFIRREILALEAQGLEVDRIAIRGWREVPIDAADRTEQARTRYVLESGAGPLAAAVLRIAVRTPLRFVSAVRLAFRTGWHSERGLAYHLIYLAEACRVLIWLREREVTHLHAHFGTNAACVAMLVRALGGPPYSFTVHGPEEFDKPQLLALGRKIQSAMFVVAISSFGRSQLLRWCRPSDWARIEVVHCGLDRSYFDTPHTSPPLAPRLVCVGRLCEQKGQLLLIEAARRLAAEGVNFELVLAGDGEMRPAIESALVAHRLEDRVRITGWIDGEQVRREILAARAMVLPSFAEGLPVVLMEAMALRRPVISTYVAGIPELVVNGECGWLVAAGSVEDLVSAMAQALRCPTAALEAMGERAYRRVMSRHQLETEATRLADLIAAGRSACANTHDGVPAHG